MSSQGFTQINGGQHVYEFLRLSPSARATGAGGNYITVRDQDASLALMAPSLLNPSQHNHASFNHTFHVAGIQAGSLTYARHISSWKTNLLGGVQYVGYGNFDGRDNIGLQTSDFKAQDVSLVIGASRQYSERISYGLNLKAIFSSYESYSSFGLAADASVTYQDTARQTVVTLTFRNMGAQLSTFDGQRESLPFDVQLGFSKRLKYLPFRLSVIGHNLHRWDVSYDDPSLVTTSNLFGEPEESTESAALGIVDNFFRHIIVGGELYIGKRDLIQVRFAYDHMRRHEMSIKNARSLAGFSFGAGVNIKRFQLDYGRGTYHLGGATNHIGITTRFGL